MLDSNSDEKLEGVDTESSKHQINSSTENPTEKSDEIYEKEDDDRDSSDTTEEEDFNPNGHEYFFSNELGQQEKHVNESEAIVDHEEDMVESLLKEEHIPDGFDLSEDEVEMRPVPGNLKS